jgi:hypothetical protein
MIGDNFKVRRALVIHDLFMSFVKVCPPCILLMSKGIDYLLNLYVNNLHNPKPPSVDTDEDRRSMTAVFMWFL